MFEQYFALLSSRENESVPDSSLIGSDVVSRLRILTMQHENDLACFVRAYYALSEKLKRRYLTDSANDTFRSEFVLTHGDALGLNLIRRRRNDNSVHSSLSELVLGAYVVVDWDSILLAPCERDIWFFVHPDPAHCQLAAQLERSNLRIDWESYGYYVLIRFLSDWLEFVQEILPDVSNASVTKNSVELMESCLKGLETDCFGWTGALIKSLMEAGHL